MKYSNELDLMFIFRCMPMHVILRMSDDFPDYYKRTDVDVLCYDLDMCVKYLSRYSFERNDISDTHVQMDYFIGDKLDFKFDLYGEYISSGFKDDAFSLSEEHNGIITPSDDIDNLSKCYEYYEYGKEKYKEYAYLKTILDEYRK